MKKIIAILLLITFALSIVSCTTENVDMSSTDITSAETSSKPQDNSDISDTGSETTDESSNTEDESDDESSNPESSDTSNDESGDESDDSSDIESIPEDEITSTDHEFEYITKTEVAPTCTKDGYYVWECSCGDKKNEASGKKATGHSYGSWSTTKAATCTANGTETRKCSACSKTETQSIAATGHTWDNGKVTTATGSGCGATGVKTYTCTTCKTTKVEQMEGNHTYGEAFYEDWEQMHDIGYGQFKTTFRAKYQKCTNCGYKKTTVAAHECVIDAFVLDYTKVVRQATCTVKEKKRTTCPTCAYYWEWETDYATHNIKPDPKKHLTDYTQYTNELDVIVHRCTNCDYLRCEYIRGEGYATDGIQSYIRWGINYGDAELGGAWDCSGDIYSTTFLEHPDWQVVLRDIKYDDKGCFSQVTVHWVDANGRRYSYTLIVSEIPNMAKELGLDVDQFKTSEGYRCVFTLILRDGRIRVRSVGYTG